MNIPTHVLEECRLMLKAGASSEQVIHLMRERGLPKVHSIKALVDLGLFDLAEAKRTVHTSATWADAKKQDDDFQQKLGEF